MCLCKLAERLCRCAAKICEGLQSAAKYMSRRVQTLQMHVQACKCLQFHVKACQAPAIVCPIMRNHTEIFAKCCICQSLGSAAMNHSINLIPYKKKG